MVSMPKPQARVEDRISALPDELLCHMMSFLPTTCAVSTTILSKRWNNLWTSVPVLDFEDEQFDNDPAFKSFVNWVLDFRGSSNIKTFKLECCRYNKFHCSSYFHKFNVESRRNEYLSLIRHWICTAIGRNLVELDLLIDFCPDQTEFELPTMLFTCNTLEVLKLGSNFIIKKPLTSRCFPSLKFLHVSVRRPDNDSMQNLFSHFPVLEDLVIHALLGQKENLTVNISAPKLKKVSISLWVDHGDPHEYSFYIKAPNLESFEVLQDNLCNFTLENPKSLVKAELYLRDCYVEKRPDRAIALLEEISNVQYFFLRGNSLKDLCLPAFDNLNQLKLDLTTCHGGTLLTEFLNRLPKLESLNLEYSYICDEEINRRESVPICLSSHLRTISIRGFQGKQVEMELAKYLLKNCRVLDKMTIYTGFLYRKEKVLCEEFTMFQRGSTNCQVEFVYRK